MKRTTRNAAKRYSAAKALLRGRKDKLVFYNSYPSGNKSLKVYFFGWKKSEYASIRKVSKELRALADHVGQGERGGHIYSFTFQS